MGDLQVSSTTDTQEQVNQAAGAVEIKVEPDEQVDATDPEGKATEVKQAEEKPKPEKLQKRIDKLTAQKSAAERRAQQLETELAKAKEVKPSVIVEAEKEEEVAEAVAAADDPEPKQEDFDTYEKWIKAQTRWEIRQEMREQEAKQAKEAEDAAAKEVLDTYNERAAEFRATVDDWEEVVGNPNLLIHPGVQVTLMEMEEGPQIAYMLGKNPELCKKIFEMSEPRAIAEIGKIAASLEVKEPQTERKTGPDKLPISNAPPPVRQLTAHSTRSSVDPDNMDYSEYRKWRDKQEKERYRR